MKILVTGSTGRIGANLVKSLLEKGHDIRSFVYPGDASRAHKLDGYERVETVFGDLRNVEDVERAVEGVDVVYHLAAAFGGPFNHSQYLDINAGGTLNILETIRAHSPDLHRLVYTSTEAVYWEPLQKGRFYKEPITELMVSRYHAMAYFLTKWIGEELCMAYHHQYGIPSTVFRLATVIEPSEFLDDAGLPGRFLLGPLYRQLQGRSGNDPAQQQAAAIVESLWTGQERFLLRRNPDGSPHKQHYCDIRDIVQGLVLGMERPEAVGAEFNLAGAALFVDDEVIPYLSRRYQIGYAEATLPVPDFFEFDLTKIKGRLGFQPQHGLESVLDTAEAMRRNEDTGVLPTGVRYGEA